MSACRWRLPWAERRQRAFAWRWSMPSRRRAARLTPAPRRCRRRARACSPFSASGRELADGAQAITTIEITDSSLDARRRPHLLGFDDDLKPGESGAYMIENEDLVRALKSAVLREPAIEMLAPDSVTAFAATPFCYSSGACKRRQARGQAPHRRRRQALALARACRHQMRRLELPATRHRHHGGACEAASRQSRAAFPPRRSLRHAAAQGQSLLHRVDGRQDDGRGDHGGRRSDVPRRARRSASARGSATSRLPARANPSRSIFRSRAAS